MKSMYYVDYYTLNEKELPWSNTLWTRYTLKGGKLVPLANKLLWCSTTTARVHRYYNRARVLVLEKKLYNKLTPVITRRGHEEYL